MGQRLTPARETVEGTVRGYLDALNAHDADRVASWVADDFVNEHTAKGAISRYGRAEYRAALDSLHKHGARATLEAWEGHRPA